MSVISCIVVAEPALCDVVIINPVSYLVAPVATLICNHDSSAMGLPSHTKEVHRICQKNNSNRWKKMVKTGVIDNQLLQMLLADYKHHYDTLVELMLKFDFLVKLPSSDENKIEYMVPALLPFDTPSFQPEQELRRTEYSTCYIVFASPNLSWTNLPVTSEYLRSNGFLPPGVFERLIGKAVKWTQVTSPEESLLCMTRTKANLLFKRRKFWLTLRTDLCSIEVNFEGPPLRCVYNWLLDRLESILQEYMMSLYCFVVLPYTLTGSPGDVEFVRLKVVEKVCSDETTLPTGKGRPVLENWEVRRMFRAWLPREHLKGQYDVFLSYRWEGDAKLVLEGR